MTGDAIVCRLRNIQPIDGADRIVQAHMMGETVIVGTDHREGELGIMFDCETQLSHGFCVNNNLYRSKYGWNVDPEANGFFEDSRRVRALRLRGVKCSAFWMPFKSLAYTGVNLSKLLDSYPEGTQFTKIEKHEICSKYIPKSTARQRMGNRTRKTKENLCPTFKQHVDTDHLFRNMHMIKDGDHVVVTLKVHGTSGRCGYLPIIQKQSWFSRLLKRPVGMEYGFVVGSRRVTKSIEGEELEDKVHFYNDDIWTIASEQFKGLLRKGETVYFEIVGYLPSGEPIHPFQSTKKLKNTLFKGDSKGYDEFVDQFGEKVDVTYGCKHGEYGVYVYRMTMTNEDGQQVDLSWDQVMRRCQDMGVCHVPEIMRGYMRIEEFGLDDYDGKSSTEDWVLYPRTDERIVDESFMFQGTVDVITNQPICDFFPKTPREGVVVRVDNGESTVVFLKHKSFVHKYLEGILKDQEEFVDLEESQG